MSEDEGSPSRARGGRRRPFGEDVVVRVDGHGLLHAPRAHRNLQTVNSHSYPRNAAHYTTN